MKLWSVIDFINKDRILLYKHECTNFNTNTKLIVREGQIAIFVKNGIVCDIFKPGRYTLKTENIPLLSKAINSVATGGINSYTAELFFLSTVDQLNIKWGTRTPMDLQDPNYKVIVKVGASGESTFSIVNPLSFMRKITGVSMSINSECLSDYFRSIINTYVKNCISDVLTVNKISILDINSCLIKLSTICCKYLNTKILEYGIVAKNFTIETINIPENDPSIIKLKSILEKKAEMDILGYSYQEERSFNVMDNATSNQTSSGIANSLMEIGLGFGLATPIAKNVSNVADVVNAQFNKSHQGQTNENGWICKCGKKNITSNFCPYCGESKEKQRWNCPNCGKENITSAFCPDCGNKKPNN